MGEGWGSFGERYASHLGQYAIQRSIMFPVQAIDHEDTRYSGPIVKATRAPRDAFLHTVWRHDDEGGMMPAYSEFFGDYGAAVVRGVVASGISDGIVDIHCGVGHDSDRRGD